MNNLHLQKNQLNNTQCPIEIQSEMLKGDMLACPSPSLPSNPPQDNLLQTLYNQNILYLKLMENIEKNTYINNFYQQFNQQLIHQNNAHNSIMHSLLTGFVLQNSLISTQILFNLCNDDVNKAASEQSQDLNMCKPQQAQSFLNQQNTQLSEEQNSQQLQLEQESSQNQDQNEENILEGLTDISISSIDLDELQIYAELDLENIFNQQKGLSKKDIKNIPLYIYQGRKKGFALLEDFYGLNKKSKKIKKSHQCKEKNTDSSTNSTCCICLNEYRKGSKVRQLPCKHKFHCSCIDRWLQKNSKCPYCKKEATNTL